ncbi:TPA: NYN domain-containing protein, partial [Proteus mirabilis]
AAKHARTKGIDFILDPLRQDVSPTLSEHIDGIQSYSLISAIADILQVTPEPMPDWWEDKVARSVVRKKTSKHKTKPKRR